MIELKIPKKGKPMYDFITIDFETANHDMNSACSVGIVSVKDLEIVKKEYFLIKPPTNAFNSKNVAIHGITYDDVKDCDTFDLIWPKVSYYFTEVIIAHNPQFDMSVLKNLLDYYNLSYDDFTYLDSTLISNPVCNCGTGLSDRASFFGIDEGAHHNALDDAVTCANIVICSVKAFGCNSFIQFALKCEGLKAKDFSALKSNKTFVRKFSIPDYSNVKLSNLTATTTEFNLSHPFYGKNIVLTGELSSFSRPDAAQKILDVGGVIKSSVSGKTDYLVVGIQDISLVGSDGLSSKEEKAYDLIKKGSGIKIIKEDEFVKLLKS